jgi:hypothetical protein
MYKPMKIGLAVLGLSILSCNIYAQVEKIDDIKKQLATENKDTIAWQHGGMINLGINQGFIHNWPAGGELASLAVNGIFNGYLVHYHHNLVWSNNLDMGYGLNYVYSNDFIPRKVDDRIDFTSKYGCQLKKNKDLFYTALFNLKSQFAKGFDYSKANWDSAATSGFMSPAYLTLAAGIEYRRGTHFTLFFSPIAGRATYASAQYTKMTPQGAFGIAYGKTSRYEFGAYLTSRYTAELTKMMTFNTRLDLYSNYLAKDTKDNNGNIKKDNPGNIQVLWDNLLTWKANKWLGMTIGCTIAYSNDNPYTKPTGIGTDKSKPGDGLGWVQFKQAFTLGLVRKF